MFVSSDEDVSFEGNTLLLAAVSNGNVGQLAIDCLIYTCALKVASWLCCGAARDVMQHA